MKKILLVEDDKEIVEVLKYILEKQFVVEVARTKSEAIKIMNNGYDLAILDVTLPDGTSFEFSEDLKCPIVYLTAKDDEDSILTGLTLGEEYIVKPFKAKELLMRIDKILKRTETDKLYFKDICMDKDVMKVYVNGEEIGITVLEFKIMELIFTRSGVIITRDILAELIYDNTRKYVEDNTISVYMKRIRDKLGRDYIKTIKKVGYVVEKE